MGREGVAAEGRNFVIRCVLSKVGGSGERNMKQSSAGRNCVNTTGHDYSMFYSGADMPQPPQNTRHSNSTGPC